MNAPTEYDLAALEQAQAGELHRRFIYIHNLRGVGQMERSWQDKFRDAREQLAGAMARLDAQATPLSVEDAAKLLVEGHPNAAINARTTAADFYGQNRKALAEKLRDDILGTVERGYEQFKADHADILAEIARLKKAKQWPVPPPQLAEGHFMPDDNHSVHGAGGFNAWTKQPGKLAAARAGTPAHLRPGRKFPTENVYPEPEEDITLAIGKRNGKRK